jgi:hypothetical protein
MASFKAELKVGKFTTVINFFRMEILQQLDQLGRPASRTQGGTMTIEFNSTDDNQVNQWMIDPAMRLSGSIVFLRIDAPVKLREVLFENAYCISMVDRVDNTGTSGNMVTTIVVSPEKVNVGNVLLDKKWPATE